MDPKTNGVQSGHDNELQGEGNYDATRRYDQGVKQSIEKGKTEELAEKAKKALEGPEGEELRKADEKGKAGEPADGGKSMQDKHGANKNVGK
jgi:hypothetical protein